MPPRCSLTNASAWMSSMLSSSNRRSVGLICSRSASRSTVEARVRRMCRFQKSRSTGAVYLPARPERDRGRPYQPVVAAGVRQSSANVERGRGGLIALSHPLRLGDHHAALLVAPPRLITSPPSSRTLDYRVRPPPAGRPNTSTSGSRPSFRDVSEVTIHCGPDPADVVALMADPDYAADTAAKGGVWAVGFPPTDIFVVGWQAATTRLRCSV
jgi:hypothetical protein